jgi:hypothetical protein
VIPLVTFFTYNRVVNFYRDIVVMEEQQTQTQKTRKQRRAGMEQLRDAMKDIEVTLTRLSETNNRILKNKLEALETLVGKHCGQISQAMAQGMTQGRNTTRKAKLSVIPEVDETETTLAPEPAPAPGSPALAGEEPPKMMSKARVIDQTFNEFRTAVSETMKTMGKPLTTEGSKAVSDAWKSAKGNDLKAVKNSLKTLGLPESYVSPMADRTVEEAQSYLARTQKVKATPMTHGKTRKVSMRKPKSLGSSSLPRAIKRLTVGAKV